jgi:Domain of unknown function (DUF4157)
MDSSFESTSRDAIVGNERAVASAEPGVARRAAPRTITRAVLRAPMMVGQAGDRSEAEADRVATAVMRDLERDCPTRGPAVDTPTATSRTPRIRRKTWAAGLGADGGEVDEETDDAIRRASGGGRPLETRIRRGMEHGFGADFSGVRVHADTVADALSGRIQARAFTFGNDIFFRRGLYQPASSRGQELIAHELTHVVQQADVTRPVREGSPVMLSRCAVPSRRSVARDWEPDDAYHEKWDELVDDVQWYRSAAGLLWYEDRTGDQRYQFWAGRVHQYSPEQWDQIEIKATRPIPGHAVTEQDGPKKSGKKEQLSPDKALLQALAPVYGPGKIFVGSAEAVLPLLEKQLAIQTLAKNYDRLIYINQYLTFLTRHPELTLLEALYLLPLDSSSLAGLFTGGHCAALSGDLLKTADVRDVPSYLVASILPETFQQKFAPKYCHAGGIIKFEHPKDKGDRGYIIVEPGFNITVPIVVRPGKPCTLPQGEEQWVFTLSDDEKEIVCQPQPTTGEKWKASKQREKRMVYRTDQILNPDEAITKQLLGVDRRPPILARDKDGNVVAKLLVNYQKAWIELATAGKRIDPVPFDQVDPDGGWLKKACPGIEAILKIPFDELAARVFQAVEGKDILAELADQIAKAQK